MILCKFGNCNSGKEHSVWYTALSQVNLFTCTRLDSFMALYPRWRDHRNGYNHVYNMYNIQSNNLNFYCLMYLSTFLCFVLQCGCRASSACWVSASVWVPCCCTSSTADSSSQPSRTPERARNGGHVHHPPAAAFRSSSPVQSSLQR